MKTRKHIKTCLTLTTIVMLLLALAIPVSVAAAGNNDAAVTETVEETTEDNTASMKAIAAAITMAIAASTGAIAMGMSISKSVEGIARQPEAEGKIRTSLMLGLVFIETAIIYALLTVILIIFVL